MQPEELWSQRFPVLDESNFEGLLMQLHFEHQRVLTRSVELEAQVEELRYASSTKTNGHASIPKTNGQCKVPLLSHLAGHTALAQTTSSPKPVPFLESVKGLSLAVPVPAINGQEPDAIWESQEPASPLPVPCPVPTSVLLPRSDSEAGDDKTAEGEEAKGDMSAAEATVDVPTHEVRGVGEQESAAQTPAATPRSPTKSPVEARWELIVEKAMQLMETSVHSVRPFWSADEWADDEDGHHSSIVTHYLSLDIAMTTGKKSQHRASVSIKDIELDYYRRDWKELIYVPPYSRRRLCWIFGSFVFLIHDVVVLSVEVFQELDHFMWKVVQLLSLVFWTFDIVMSFLTGIYIDGQAVMSPKAIARKYMMSWFVFDLALVIPEWVNYTLSDGSSRVAGSFKGLRVMRGARLFRLAKLTYLIDMALDYVNDATVVTAVHISLYVLAIVGWVHLSGCVWFLVGTGEGPSGWVDQHDLTFDTPLSQYFRSIQWASVQFQGSTSVNPGTSIAENAYAVIAVFFSVILLAVFVSKLTNLLLNLQTVLKSKAERNTWFRKYLQRNRISTKLCQRVRKTLEQAQGRDISENARVELEMLQFLPTALRRELLTEARAHAIVSNPVFLSWRQDFMRCFERLCCDTMGAVWLIADEDAFASGELCSIVYYVSRGRLAYVKHSEVMQALNAAYVKDSRMNTNAFDHRKCVVKETHSLCEAALWTTWVYRGNCQASDESCLFVLEVARFDSLVQAFPLVRMGAARHAKMFVRTLNERDLIDSVSDLFDSAQMLNMNLHSSDYGGFRGGSKTSSESPMVCD